MKTVPASEFQKNFGAFKELAQREAVGVTSNGRESVVLISAGEYAALMKLKQQSYAYGGEVNDAFKNDLAAISDAHSDVLDGLSR
jgi:prevent-host-death family protein